MTQPVSHERWLTVQWTVVKLVLGWIFGGSSLGSSRDFTEVCPVLAAGGRLAHLPEPRAELLETDLGTYADKILLLWKLLASQADKGASGRVITEDRGAAVQRGWRHSWRTLLPSILLSNVRNLHFYTALSSAIETKFSSPLHCKV